ncbi:MAG: ADP-ribosylglycohydrolase family protein [Steroidobacteraceae bacterium]
MSRSELARPLDNSYWVDPGRFLAGEHPSGKSDAALQERLSALLAAGITQFVDLTSPTEFQPYEAVLRQLGAPGAARYHRAPIPDHGLPQDPAVTAAILDQIDTALASDRPTYLHCRAGIGRTNLVVGCWLVRRGHTGQGAISRLNQLWLANARSRFWSTVPETPEQVSYVLGWSEPRRAVSAARQADERAAVGLRTRYRGLLLGMAVGDALGQATLHRRPGSFNPVGDLLGGGPYALPRGAWGDKTAMGLCLAESLVAQGEVDLPDLLGRLLRWQAEGHLTSTGTCVGISAETAGALAKAEEARDPRLGSHDPSRPGKEPLGRVGPVVGLLLSEPERAIEAAAEVTRVTHQAPATLDAVRYFAALLVGALQGASRAELLKPGFSPVEGYWKRRPLGSEVGAVAAGSWARKQPPRISGGGQAVDALEAALWAFASQDGFRPALLAAANLGQDADLTAAMVGQLAGAFAGQSAIPEAWQASISGSGRILSLADALLERALRRIPA